jgi:hypothetical protein
MIKQTFKIVDGIYKGPDVWEGSLDLRPYKDTLTSLGDLKKVESSFWLMDCTRLTSLGSLKEVGGWLSLFGCTSLTSLGDLKEVRGWLAINGCTNLVSLGLLKEVEGMMALEDCTSLTSLGTLEEVGGSLDISLQELREKVFYYSSLPLHDALNALHIKEVQKIPLYKNILLQTLQGG